MSPAKPASAKEPKGDEWTCRGPVVVHGEFIGTAWRSGPITAISQLADMDLPGGAGKAGPTWLLSITDRGKRPKPHHVRRARRAFGMQEAEVDNHHPGQSVHLFLPVDPAFRGICECKTDESQVREPDGYTWSQSTEGPCRGCELETAMASVGKAQPCPVHAPTRTTP